MSHEPISDHAPSGTQRVDNVNINPTDPKPYPTSAAVDIASFEDDYEPVYGIDNCAMGTHGRAMAAEGWPVIPILPPYASPIISTAKLEPGKVPGQYINGKGWVGVRAWTSRGVPTAAELDRWCRGNGTGVGVVCGVPCGDGGSHVVALDIDILDEDLASDVEAAFRMIAGDGILRVGNWPKRILVFRSKEPIAPAATPFFDLPADGDDHPGHRVEVIGRGRQFVAYGQHPKTRSDYEWPTVDLSALAPGDLPVIAADDVENLTDIASTLIGKAGGVARKAVSRSKTTSRCSTTAGPGVQGHFYREHPKVEKNPEDMTAIDRLNALALTRLDDWVPHAFPEAYKGGNGAWRVTSEALCRDLQEDLSLHPDGIWDYGEEVPHTAVGAVAAQAFLEDDGIEEGDLDAAANWLADALGFDLQAELAVDLAGSFEVVAEEVPADDRGTQELEEKKTFDKVVVSYRPEAMAEIVDACIEIINRDPVNARVLQFGGQYVRVEMRPPTTVREVGDGSYPPMPIVLPFTTASVKDRLMRSVVLNTGSKTKPKYIAVPEALAAMLLARSGQDVPPLTGTLEAPTQRADGSVLATPGYDPETGLFAVFDPERFEMVPAKPSRDDASRAYRYLADEVFAEFPFATETDCAVAVVALLTALIRRTLPGECPVFAISAPSPASGKTTIIDLIFRLVFGRPAAAHPFPSSEEEVGKVLIALLKEGHPGVLFDNVPTGSLVNSAKLAAAVTQPTYSDRLLGSNITGTYPTSVLWTMTGNNLALAGDMPSRCLVSYVDPQVDRPDKRTFARPDLASWAQANRARAVQAGLTLLKAYSDAGRPSMDAPPSRFPAFDSHVRYAAIWAGAPDVGIKFDLAYEQDPVRNTALEGLRAIHLITNGQMVSAGEILGRVRAAEGVDENVPAIKQAITEFAGCRRFEEITNQRLGKTLAKHLNFRVGGLALERGKEPGKGNTAWRVVET